MIEVEVSGRPVPRLSRTEIRTFAAHCVRAIRRGSFGLTIALLDDAEMRSLNRTFRGKRKTTDVLTFPGEGRYLGDVVISIEQAKRQARAEGHSLSTEIRYLILHGILHSFGYDHETDRGEMDAFELKLRRRVGLE